MHAALDGERARLQTAGGSVAQALPTARGTLVSISAETYSRLLSLADQAPLECLPLTSRTLACAKTLGYNHIGQIRSAPPHRLLADLGEDRAQELTRALFDFGMRPVQADAGG